MVSSLASIQTMASTGTSSGWVCLLDLRDYVCVCVCASE